MAGVRLTEPLPLLLLKRLLWWVSFHSHQPVWPFFSLFATLLTEGSCGGLWWLSVPVGTRIFYTSKSAWLLSAGCGVLLHLLPRFQACAVLSLFNQVLWLQPRVESPPGLGSTAVLGSIYPGSRGEVAQVDKGARACWTRWAEPVRGATPAGQSSWGGTATRARAVLICTRVGEPAVKEGEC